MTGLFGGTFDPIHYGHINIALQIKELKRLDRILVCPANISPSKQDRPPQADVRHRLEMCRLAVKDIPGFEVIDLEVQRGGVSYTIDTVKELGIKELTLVLAEDTLPGFEKWKGYDELITLCTPVFGSRAGIQSAETHFEKFKTRVMEISSTDIRKRLNKGVYLTHWMPRAVLDYIHANQLYNRG